MARLVLLRHAKSAYPTDVPDYRRPLSDRGRRDAPVAGERVRALLGDPDLVLVSGAARTRETWELARAAWPHPPHTAFDDRIYEASVDELLLLLREVDSARSDVVVIGHNPGIEELAFTISDGQGDAAAITAMGTKFPTSAMAMFDIEYPWAHLAAERARLSTFEVARGQ